MKASGNRFFLVFGLIIHFMATTTKAKRCIFISRTPKCPGYWSILNKSRWYRLFSALLRSQFGPIQIPFSWLSEMQWKAIHEILEINGYASQHLDRALISRFLKKYQYWTDLYSAEKNVTGF